MIQAILRRKVDRRVRRSEDVLTSNVFGMLAALAPGDGLVPWFCEARRLDSVHLVDELTNHTYAFWPSLVLPDGRSCEPYLLLLPPNALGRVGFVECKMFSGPSGRPTPDEDLEVR